MNDPHEDQVAVLREQLRQKRGRKQARAQARGEEKQCLHENEQRLKHEQRREGHARARNRCSFSQTRAADDDSDVDCSSTSSSLSSEAGDPVERLYDFDDDETDLGTGRRPGEIGGGDVVYPALESAAQPAHREGEGGEHPGTDADSFTSRLAPTDSKTNSAITSSIPGTPSTPDESGTYEDLARTRRASTDMARTRAQDYSGYSPPPSQIRHRRQAPDEAVANAAEEDSPPEPSSTQSLRDQWSWLVTKTQEAQMFAKAICKGLLTIAGLSEASLRALPTRPRAFVRCLCNHHWLDALTVLAVSMSSIVALILTLIFLLLLPLWVPSLLWPTSWAGTVGNGTDLYAGFACPYLSLSGNKTVCRYFCTFEHVPPFLPTLCVRSGIAKRPVSGFTDSVEMMDGGMARLRQAVSLQTFPFAVRQLHFHMRDMMWHHHNLELSKGFSGIKDMHQHILEGSKGSSDIKDIHQHILEGSKRFSGIKNMGEIMELVHKLYDDSTHLSSDTKWALAKAVSMSAGLIRQNRETTEVIEGMLSSNALKPPSRLKALFGIEERTAEEKRFEERMFQHANGVNYEIERLEGWLETVADSLYGMSDTVDDLIRHQDGTWDSAIELSRQVRADLDPIPRFYIRYGGSMRHKDSFDQEPLDAAHQSLVFLKDVAVVIREFENIIDKAYQGCDAARAGAALMTRTLMSGEGRGKLLEWDIPYEASSSYPNLGHDDGIKQIGPEPGTTSAAATSTGRPVRFIRDRQDVRDELNRFNEVLKSGSKSMAAERERWKAIVPFQGIYTDEDEAS